MAPYWPGRICFTLIPRFLNRVPWPLPLRQDVLSQSGECTWHPHPDCLQLHVGAGLLLSSCKQTLLQTILDAWASLTRVLYANCFPAAAGISMLTQSVVLCLYCSNICRCCWITCSLLLPWRFMLLPSWLEMWSACCPRVLLFLTVGAPVAGWPHITFG